MRIKRIIISCLLATMVVLSSMFFNIYKASADNSWKEIKKSGELTIGLTGDYAPWQTTSANGKLGGYDVAFAKKVCKDLGLKPVFKTGQFAGLIPALNNGKFNILFGGLQSTPERRKILLVSVPYAADGTVAVVRKGSNGINSIKDIKGKIIGVGSGSSFEADVKKIGGYKELKEYKAPTDAFNDLKLKRIDAVAIGAVAAKNYIKNSTYGKGFKTVGKPYKKYNIVLAMKKGDKTLAKKVNEAIKKEIANGNAKRLQKKYLGLTTDYFK